MPKKSRTIYYKPLDDDRVFDEVRLKAKGGTVLRAFTKYRYKTSGLSGNEWRVSVTWEVANGYLDGNYRDIEVACAALYPMVFSSLAYMHNVEILYADWMKKSQIMYRSSYDGKSLPLLPSIGHLSWGYIRAKEDFSIPVEFDKNEYCFQPGCAEKPVSEYRLRLVYDEFGGNEREPDRDTHRKFCRKHLMRGDCGLEDADRNYIVLSGPGPDEAEGWEKYESESVFGGFINLADIE